KQIPVFSAPNVEYAIDRFRFYRGAGIRGCDVVVTSGCDLPKRKNQKMVIIVHDVIHKAFPGGHSPETIRAVDAGFRRVARDADAFIAVSETTRNDLMTFYDIPANRIFKIYSGCNSCLEKPGLAVAQKILAEKFGVSGDYILFLGTLEPRKNIENLLKAYARLCRKGAPEQFVIAGMKGWMFDGIFETVQQLALTDRVIFTDYISYEEKQCLYRLAKIFVFPSFYEGFGLPILEAMDYGVPVITSNVSSMPEVAGDAALLVDPHDWNAIADCMERLLADENLRGQLRSKGLERVKMFDWRVTAQRFLEFFEKLS
ncbi:MAG TPA: glycosyltransferase family 1 protein, partial [Candidatus Bathyarchaeia archaeon]|nr:glycosyltransferase family 1 protein [Candidatus Bathyarchaeia archaeon]